MADLDLKPEDTKTDPRDNAESSPEDAQVKANEIITNVQKKIDAGDKSHSDYPDWIQKETRPKVNEDDLKKKHFAEFKKEQNNKLSEDDKEKSKKAFEALKSQIPKDISDDDFNSLNDILEEEHEKGRPEDDALEYAMYKMGIPSNKNESIKKGIRIARQSLIPKGDYVVQKEDKASGEKKTEDKYINNLPEKFKPKK